MTSWRLQAKSLENIYLKNLCNVICFVLNNINEWTKYIYVYLYVYVCIICRYICLYFFYWNIKTLKTRNYHIKTLKYIFSFFFSQKIYHFSTFIHSYMYVLLFFIYYSYILCIIIYLPKKKKKLPKLFQIHYFFKNTIINTQIEICMNKMY